MKIVGPVFIKELFQLAQSRRLVIMKGVFFLFMFLGFLLIASEGSKGYNRDEFGVMLYAAVAVLNAGAILLFTPIVTASAVSGEREANTLGLLLLTRLSAWNIVQDKGLSRMSLLLFLISLTFPLMAASVLYGGVEMRHVICAIGNIIGLGLMTSGLSIFFSAARSKFSGAVASTYVALLVWLLLVPIGVALYFQGGVEVAFINPFMSVGMTFESTMGGYLDASWMVNLAIGAGVYLVCTTAAALIVRRMAMTDTVHVSTESRGFLVALKRLGYVTAHANPLLFLRAQRLGNQNPLAWQCGRIAPGSHKPGLYNVVNVLCLLLAGVIIAVCVIISIWDGGTRFAYEIYSLSVGSVVLNAVVVGSVMYHSMIRSPTLSKFPWMIWVLSIVCSGLALLWIHQSAGELFTSARESHLPGIMLVTQCVLVGLSLLWGYMALRCYVSTDDHGASRFMDTMCALANVLNVALFMSATYWVLRGILDGGGTEWMFYFVYCVGYGIAMLIVVILGASSFAREKQTGTFSILLSTCLSGRQIVSGVVRGTFRTMVPFLSVCLGVLFMGEALDPSEYGVLASIANLVVQFGFALVLAIWMSLIRKTPAQAIIITFVILICLYAVIPIFAEIMNAEFYQCSPGFLLAVSLMPSEFRGDDVAWWWVATLCVYLPATVGIYFWMCYRFNKITGRQEEDWHANPERETSSGVTAD